MNRMYDILNRQYLHNLEGSIDLGVNGSMMRCLVLGRVPNETLTDKGNNFLVMHANS